MQFLPSGDLAAVADLYYLISERFEDRMPYGTERVGNFGVCRDYIRNLRSQFCRTAAVARLINSEKPFPETEFL